MLSMVLWYVSLGQSGSLGEWGAAAGHANGGGGGTGGCETGNTAPVTLWDQARPHTGTDCLTLSHQLADSSDQLAVSSDTELDQYPQSLLLGRYLY